MTLALGCIADDYTGASDLANTLTRNGLRTVQTIGIPADDLKLPEVDAVVVSLKSRSIAASVAVEKSRAADKWLRSRGASHVLFKICSTFDSTDSGNIGPVMDALRMDAGDNVVLVTPAFPETGRTVYQGNLFVGSVPLNESPLKDHPLNPMHDSNLVRVLARQSETNIGLVDLGIVATGADVVRAHLDGLSENGFGAAIVDAVFATDLETIGAVALDHRVSVGASGLGLGLARGLVASGRVKAADVAASAGTPVGGAAACLAGSCSQATLQQIARAEQAMPVLHLDSDRIIAGKDEIQRAIAWARDHLHRGPILIASSATPDQVAKLQQRHGRDAVGHAIEQAMADLAEALVGAGVRRLVVAGGETSGAVV
ncbi:MAG: 3-oxo-tetronate kinase, partial [Tardiphaga sp.]